jgi:hypothetical protein
MKPHREFQSVMKQNEQATIERLIIAEIPEITPRGVSYL